jgi:hypothetical protein
MKYAVEIAQMDATELLERIEGEPLDSFHERQDEARGQAFWRLVILDCAALEQDSAAAFVVGSPCYEAKNEGQKWSLLNRALKEAKKKMVDRERKKTAIRN